MRQVDVDEDYEHWRDDDSRSWGGPKPAPGYDSHNGLRTHIYRPALSKKSESTHSAPAPQASSTPAYIAAPPLYYLPPQHGVAPHTGVAIGQPHPHVAPQVMYAPPVYPGYFMYPGYGSGYEYGYYPPQQQPSIAAGSAAVEEHPNKSKPKTFTWQGRTRQEVEEDDIRIATRSGAYAPRSVQPVGLAPAQMVWCVDADGKSTLRPYATVTKFHGEWKADPRFENAWYFLRSAE